MARTHAALHLNRPADDDEVAVLASDFDATAIEQTGSDSCRLFFSSAIERDRALAELSGGAGRFGVEAIEVPDEDWASRSQAFLTAVTIGDLIVTPPLDVPAASDRRVIVIEPSMGFGTGHHQSTRLCLQAAQMIFRLKGAVLDVGCGSGVLAIAASLLGAEDVVGIDIDPDAVESARRNLALNRGARAQFECAGVESFTAPPRDVVFANLIMELLRQHATPLAALVKGDGLLIASGFTEEQEQDVLTAFAALSQPFRAVNRFTEGDWIALVLERLQIAPDVLK